MIKVRIQGTEEDMEWFIGILRKIELLRIINPSGPISNVGTRKYFRRYFEIEIMKE